MSVPGNLIGQLESLSCDVTVNNFLPLHNTRLLRAYARHAPCAVALVQQVIEGREWGNGMD